MGKPLVIQTEELDSAPAAWLAERCELVRCGAADKGYDLLLAGAEALVIRTYTRVDQAMLAGAPKLRVVGRAGVGLDNVDLEACGARGVQVVYTPDANSEAVVEYVWTMLTDALRPHRYLTNAPDARGWGETRKALRAARELNQMTLGILGLGRIGKRMARVGTALGMRVLYHDLLSIASELRAGAEPVGFEELLRSADILTVHVDGRPANRHLLNERAFALLKPDAVFVNAARGFLVDNSACAAFFASHPAARALLDVHDPEPFGPSYPLLGLPNIRLSPHLAAATTRAQENMSWVVRDVWRVLQGEAPHFSATTP
ncbi:MAG: 3-phosphoglycerate dehydrogenase [Planctomycetes bacterium]|nr:3-phosphoglycerate dehydrogenase [Planctomycetota bacterium]